MGNYIVSARKYRPKGFDEVVGQDHITTTLANAIKQDQLAQALLFCGPRGVGKTTCARIVANMINGFDQQNDYGSSSALNIYELDAASNNSVDDIRNLIDQVRYPPQYGKYKVYIIDEVHMLSNQAFNAFLKTLEEPPSYAIFILATTEKHKVIPTILSRCQIFDFNRIQIKDITQRLGDIAHKENIQAENEALHLLAQKADGALRDALSLFDLIVTYSSGNKITYKDTAKNLHILDYDYYFEITDALLGEDLSGTLLIFNEILKKGFDGQNFIVGLAEHLRNLLISQDTETIRLLEVSDSVKSKYISQSKTATKSFLLSALNISNQCDISYKGSKNQRLHVEIALMKMAYLKSAIKLKESPTPSTDLKKKTPPEQNIKIEEKTKQEGLGKKETHNKSQAEVVLVKSSIARKTIDIPNIDELKNKSENPSPDKVIQNGATEIKDIAKKNEFTLAELKKEWKNFAAKLKSERKNNEFNLMTKEFKLIDGHTVIIHINNTIEQDILLRFKIDLLKYLRDQLGNDLIRIDTEIAKEEQTEKLYTNTDRFNYLAKKNPNLLKLKNTFGLDTEF